MTGLEFKAALAAHGIRRKTAAQLFDVTPVTIDNWVKGVTGIHARYVEMLEDWLANPGKLAVALSVVYGRNRRSLSEKREERKALIENAPKSAPAKIRKLPSREIRRQLNEEMEAEIDAIRARYRLRLVEETKAEDMMLATLREERRKAREAAKRAGHRTPEEIARALLRQRVRKEEKS